MKVMIDIPEGIYKASKDAGVKYIDIIQIPSEVIANGTPLPDIFDFEGLKSDMKALNCGYPYGLDYLLDCLKKRLGITPIEADKERENADSD